ncbi:unnamed protein product [Durusdinium trenchii]|uniref:Dynamin N-terminal domain-containing protein n=1 Tax=Durusdinium trenchii TaxID=1381693 RepID=A0ABP0QFI9_9DINO
MPRSLISEFLPLLARLKWSQSLDAMIGIIGDSNTGKSTLLNTLLGQRLLPTSYKSCTSAITSVQLVEGLQEPELSFVWKEPEQVCGRKEVLNRIKSLNEEIRESGSKDVVDLRITCQPTSRLYDLGICDGSLRLVDMPGQDETDNPVVKDCFDQLLSMCHGLIVLVKHSAVRSDSLALLMDRIAQEAPHLFTTPGALTFVISQVDAVRIDESDDETGGGERVLRDLKKELLQYLANRDCLMLFPGFLSDVKVFCVSVDQKMVGAREFGSLVEAVGELHSIIHDLKRSRQEKLCREIYDIFNDRLEGLGKVYPSRAAEVLEQERHEQVVKQASLAVAAASFLVTIPLGGWGLAVGCAVRCAAAGTALGVGVVASVNAAETTTSGEETEEVTLGGQSCLGAGRFGAIGAQQANARVVFNRTAQTIREGRAYEDTLLDADGSPVYIGDFVGEVPHGQGRLFWKSSNFEAFIGSFKNGRPREGLFINEKGFCVARGEMTAAGAITVTGTQPDEEISVLDTAVDTAEPLESLEDFLDEEPNEKGTWKDGTEGLASPSDLTREAGYISNT